jgi:hypothetical protein
VESRHARAIKTNIASAIKINIKLISGAIQLPQKKALYNADNIVAAESMNLSLHK